MKIISTKVWIISICVITFLLKNLSAQEYPLVLDKQGTFTTLSRTDYVMPDYDFTNTEVTANLQKLNDIIAVIRKNPVLAELKGFDAQARIYTISIKDPLSYGVPVRISFEFSSWFKNKNGAVVNNKIEPPEWSIIINKLIPVFGNLTDSKHGYFTISADKKTVSPGIDVYDGERYVLYDPSKPDYWLPVTVEEAFQALKEYYLKDKESNAYLIELTEQEYNQIPAADRAKPAYSGGNLSGISTSSDYEGQSSLFPPIMKINPAYWNKTQPKSSVQFMYFSMTDNKDYLKNQTQGALKQNSTSYHLYRFEESLDINFAKSLLSLLGK